MTASTNHTADDRERQRSIAFLNWAHALDHFVLLPMESRLIQVTDHGDTIEAKFADRRWVLPRGDCVLLPIANTTAFL
jgi:hypothetical protein